MVRRIHILLAAKSSHSITRIATEYANAFVARGIDVIVSYPIIGFLDHLQWDAARDTSFWMIRIIRRWWRMLRAAVQSMRSGRGFGFAHDALDSRVRVRRILALPCARRMPDADVLLVMQNYLIPRLLMLSPQKGTVIGSVHVDYRAALADPVGAREWWEQFTRIEQRLSVPRFAVSRAAKEGAEALGIAVERVIHNGINCTEFHPIQARVDQQRALRILLYCGTIPAKGQAFGCAVLRAVRSAMTRAGTFASLGDVFDEHRTLFDVHHGYCSGRAYVQAYQDADIVIYPSLRDAFPAPPLEALACGAALATTRVQGVEEWAVHGENCLVAEPNDVDAMTRNVLRLITDDALRARLRAGGLQTARQYDWASSAERLITMMNAHA
ncbi:MAG: glycosyltransferase family 4 protein [bacterium]|nr:glycosyltransferase family 4 protein [bacterium]